jgi:hypothetical protein
MLYDSWPSPGLVELSAKDMRMCSDAQMFARISSQTAKNDHFRDDLQKVTGPTIDCLAM